MVAPGVSRPPPGRTWLTMTGADGSEWDLSAPLDPGRGGVVVMPGPTGLEMPPPVLGVEDYALLDGGAVNKVRYGSRDMMLAVAVVAPTREAVLTLRRSLRRALDPQRGPVTLSVREPDGGQRHCRAWYVGGAEGDEGRDSAGRTWAKTGVQLRAVDPFWYGPDLDLTFGMTAGTPFLSHPGPGGTVPFFPLRISRSLLTGGQVVDCLSEVDTWPVWRLNGPFGAEIRLINHTTGQRLAVAAQVEVGHVLEIDTRPGRKRVELIPPGGPPVNAWPSVDTAGLWPLAPGPNTVEVSADGATPESLIQLAYTPRYLGA